MEHERFTLTEEQIEENAAEKLAAIIDRDEASRANRFPYECEFDFMCGREFKTMDERDDHERNDHVWEDFSDDSDEDDE